MNRKRNVHVLRQHNSNSWLTLNYDLFNPSWCKRPPGLKWTLKRNHFTISLPTVQLATVVLSVTMNEHHDAGTERVLLSTGCSSGSSSFTETLLAESGELICTCSLDCTLSGELICTCSLDCTHSGELICTCSLDCTQSGDKQYKDTQEFRIDWEQNFSS